MVKVIRGPTGPALRDSRGQFTALSFTTKEGREVWISNKAVRTICALIAVLSVLMLEPSFAEPGKVILKFLRGSLS